MIDRAWSLIVEPDPARAALYKGAVTDAGLAPVLVRDGAAALEVIAKDGLPTLIITDLSLPRVDGFTLLAEVRKKSTAPVPVVVACSFLALREEAWKRRSELGITELLPKSAAAEIVRRAISRALTLSRPQREEPEDRPEAMRARGVREKSRLATVASMRIEVGAPDEALQKFVTETAAVFRVPVSLISLVLEDRQWFKAQAGLKGKLLVDGSIARESGFCRHVVEDNAPLVVPDATLNPVFASNPLVRDGSVRSYAGAPLKTPGGKVLGTLCVIDDKPLTLGPDEVDSLTALARRVAAEIELSYGARAPAFEALRLQGNAAFFEAVAWLEAVLGSLETGVFVTDAERKILYVNPAGAEMVGREIAELLGISHDAWIAHCAKLFDDPTEFLRKARVLPSGPFVAAEDFEMQRPSRRWLRWQAKPIALPSGIAQLQTFTDVTAEMDLANERRHLAMTDALTGLANRRGGEEALARETARAARLHSPLALLLLDVDRFKAINDGGGHAEGDRVLAGIARIVREAVRESDLAVRWGGDEYLAVLPGVGVEGARTVAERIRNSVEALGPDLGSEVTVSIGISEWKPGELASESISRADAALYAAKSAGRNAVR